MINKFKNFLLENADLRKGTNIISEEKAIQIILENCKDFDFNHMPIWRGVNRFDTDTFYLIDPIKEVRKNNYFDFHNVFINNTPEWSEYPRRDKCILGICDYDYIINHYSPNLFRLIPFDGAVFGVCPENDIIYSFYELQNIFYDKCGLNLYGAFKSINNIFHSIINRDINTTDFNKFKEDLDLLTNEIKINFTDDNYKGVNLVLKNVIDGGDDIFSWLRKEINPENFKLLSYPELITKYYTENELWTESKCLLIPEEYCNEVQEEIEKIKNKVTENYKINEGIQVYHGSDRKFDKFDMSKVGSGDGKNLGGWGIYFSEDENVSKRYVTTHGFLGEFEIKDGNYFDLDAILEDGNQIVRELENMGIDENQIEEFKTDYIEYAENFGDVTNKQAYDWLSYVLGGDKEASLFLKNLGYIGNTFLDKWETGSRNYVVFDTNVIIQ